MYAKAQLRIATASDGFLDVISADFFGTTLPRKTNESDAAFRNRIIINLFRERATRKAVTQVLTTLTGRAPLIVEPSRPADTGAYGGTDAITVQSAQIYRNDWQGNQLLYATPRTNGLGASEDYTTAAWAKTRSSITTPGTLNTLRGTLAQKLVEDTSAATTHFTQRTSSSSYNAGDYVCVSIIVHAAERTQLRLGVGAGGAFVSTSIIADLAALTIVNFSGTPLASGIIPLAQGWYRVWVTIQATAAGVANAQAILASSGGTSYTGDGVSGLFIDALQTETVMAASPGPTSYIACPTTAAVTVTDYTLTSSGALTLAAPPASGAALTWTGTYQSTIKGATIAVSAQTFSAGDGISTAFSLAPKYGYAIGYGVAGAYGSLVHPYQAFITAYRPLGTGIPYVAGYGSSPSGYSIASRGEYASLSMVQASVSDSDIYAAIANVIPAGTIAWVRISS
jgi:hypothetical protein